MQSIPLSEIYRNDRDALFKNVIDLIAIAEDDALQKRLLNELIGKYVELTQRMDALLKNTLPAVVADEIRFAGGYAPRQFDCTIVFTDIVGFTRLAEQIPITELITFLDRIFTEFDRIIEDCHGTKIKTIGDAYMAVFGAPEPCGRHAHMALTASMAFQNFITDFNQKNDRAFQMRIGVHSGAVIAGVVGRERMQFDVFGDNVNIASRFESSGEKGRINVSESTYLKTRNDFEFQERGLVHLKNKESMNAYFLLTPIS